ncbi:LpxL/LpxP family Kdo(2)-lipid IV(A) lauroyl/palmitoleoyl acyltransferase [Marinicella sp. S1101]|uniref:LpxL/LpxP family Kdo(2)-lipid IV(A) lauroyl/palmitoleoyl acyltransferase n=1 Tax=Marinicella marina TaxID=2996016 RepID=UPI002260D5F5|nr:LpxL/LpxP family Kdo(2)-lipid IV(A) lauroyl/palmitoleoyl acyltransferase [Marinicella marina]MCX7554227.1 LpxL/LpxP family Kdo(2)-lipid IV(A) lauroyl/palmitoleoyl acyltransferase [Marinicella marina]MDJ1138780.1 LpxL/LpxP family Kdo(2)-lipid IV(A) lauroyl/palmitoleoyl acyltransferase [Marinicella marina]
MADNAAKPAFFPNLLAWLTYGVCWLLAHLPYRLLLLIGRGMGWLFRVLFKSRRVVIEKNINACFPTLSTDEKAKLINQNYRETGMMVSQTLRTFLNRSAAPFDQLNIKGTKHLDAALAKKQGVLLVSGHFTALDIGGRAICERYPVAGVYRPHKNPVQEYIVKQAREKYATTMFSRDELKGIIKYLKKGGVVWYAPDQDYRRGQSVFVNFFGTPASTITATHQLARISGCQVLFYAVKRIDQAPFYQLEISAPMADFPSNDAEADTQRVNDAIEHMVRQAPEQYLWLHKRFKTRPEGDLPFY